jgi:betaine-aldehyde dehydrogenase
VHADIHDEVVERVRRHCARYVPGLPTDAATTMGALISREQHARVLDFIASAHAEGARLVCGGKVPDAPALAGGLYVEPTVFADVKQGMRIASQEIFGPVLSILKWTDEDRVMDEVNSVDYGLTCAIWTNDLEKAHRAAMRTQAGFVWVNEVAKHFLGAPFGGVKQSGIGREECLAELMAFTSEKNVHISLRRVAR